MLTVGNAVMICGKRRYSKEKVLAAIGLVIVNDNYQAENGAKLIWITKAVIVVQSVWFFPIKDSVLLRLITIKLIRRYQLANENLPFKKHHHYEIILR